MPQERSQNHDVEHTVDVPAPQIIEEIAEGSVSVPQQRIQERIYDTTKVLKPIPQEWVQNKVVEQILDVSVPQTVDEMANETRSAPRRRIQESILEETTETPCSPHHRSRKASWNRLRPSQRHTSSMKWRRRRRWHLMWWRKTTTVVQPIPQRAQHRNVDQMVDVPVIMQGQAPAAEADATVSSCCQQGDSPVQGRSQLLAKRSGAPLGVAPGRSSRPGAGAHSRVSRSEPACWAKYAVLGVS